MNATIEQSFNDGVSAANRRGRFNGRLVVSQGALTELHAHRASVEAGYCRAFDERLVAAAKVFQSHGGVQCEHRSMELVCRFSNGVSCTALLEVIRPHLFLRVSYDDDSLCMMHNLGFMVIEDARFATIDLSWRWLPFMRTTSSKAKKRQMRMFDRLLSRFSYEVGVRASLSDLPRRSDA